MCRVQLALTCAGLGPAAPRLPAVRRGHQRQVARGCLQNVANAQLLRTSMRYQGKERHQTALITRASWRCERMLCCVCGRSRQPHRPAGARLLNKSLLQQLSYRCCQVRQCVRAATAASTRLVQRRGQELCQLAECEAAMVRQRSAHSFGALPQRVCHQHEASGLSHRKHDATRVSLHSF